MMGFAPFGASPPNASMFDAYNQAMTQYMTQLQAVATQQGEGLSHMNQVNQMNQMAWMAQQNLAYQMAAQNYAANQRTQQQQVNFCRPTAMYATPDKKSAKNASSGNGGTWDERHLPWLKEGTRSKATDAVYERPSRWLYTSKHF